MIESSNGRAIQLRGQGATVINHGTLLGGEEVVEGRLDFTLENYALIRVRAGVVDEDGVQFASGTAHNWGLIEGSDDGIDIDEGVIYNHVGGQIISTNPADTRDSAGIDADPVLQIPSLAPALHPQAGVLTIINEGLIAGPRAIAADLERTGAIDVINSGTLRGNHGIALDYAPGMGDSQLTLFGESRIFGDVRFGGGDDTVTLGVLTSGLIIEGVFDGGAGANRVVFDGYELIDLLLFEVEDGLVYLVISTVSRSRRALPSFRSMGHRRPDVQHCRPRGARQSRIAGGLPLLLGGAGVLFGFCRRHAT